MGTTDVAVVVGSTDVFVGVVVGAGVTVSRGVGRGGISNSASSGPAVLVGRNGSLRCISSMAVAEGVAIGAGDGGVVSTDHGLAIIAGVGALVGVMNHGLSRVAVICWPAAMTTSSSAVNTSAVPASVSM